MTQLAGIVTEVLPLSLVKIRLETGEILITHIAGELRSVSVPVKAGDTVEVERSTGDPTRGSIVGVVR